MKRNVTSENPRNRTSQIMKLYENKALVDKISKMKSSIDNKPPKETLHLKVRAKDKVNKNFRIEYINRHNEQLLEKMFSIFTRRRPKEKGFDQKGKPLVKPEYDNGTLNYLIRKDQINKINQENSTILVKLHQAKPAIISKQEWKQRWKDHNSVKGLMHNYNSETKQRQRRLNKAFIGRNTFYQNYPSQSSMGVSPIGRMRYSLNSSSYPIQNASFENGEEGSWINNSLQVLDPKIQSLQAMYGVRNLGFGMRSHSSNVYSRGNAHYNGNYGYVNSQYGQWAPGSYNTIDNSMMNRPQTVMINQRVTDMGMNERQKMNGEFSGYDSFDSRVMHDAPTMVESQAIDQYITSSQRNRKLNMSSFD